MMSSSRGAAERLLCQLIGSQLPLSRASLDRSSMLYFPGRSGFAGHYQGRDAMAGVLGRLSSLTGGTLEFVPSRVVSSEEASCVLLSRVRGHRGGKHLDTEVVHIVTSRGGVIREIWLLHADQALVDEFWID